MDVVDERKQSLFDRIKNNSIIKRIRGIKNIQIIVVVFIIAIGLIIYSNVSSKNVKSTTASLMTDQESRLSAILSNIDGAGNVQSMITKDGNQIVGVLIIADGAVNPLVRIKLVQATSTALGVDDKIVSVFAKQNG